MFTPLLECISSSKSPWEVFRSLCETSHASFFLDSIHYRPPDQVYSYIGLDPFLELTVDRGRLFLRGEITAVYPASDLFKVLRGLLARFRLRRTPGRQLDFFAGGAVGYWSYELASLFETRMRFRAKEDPGIPLLHLGFYRDLIVFDHRREVYLLVALLGPGEKSQGALRLERLRTFLADAGNGAGRPELSTQEAQGLRDFRPEISQTDFQNMVRRAKTYIAAGDIYQANLSQRFSFDFEGPPLELYDHLRRINPSPFSSFLNFGELKIISSSPERLIRKRGRLCETRPIAGTRPRRFGGLSPEGVERDLIGNEKERAEHIMLVDLERNDLGRVCEYRSVRVEEMMAIERYSHVIHLVSKVVGRLARDKDALDLIRAMFPGGTITGCPKIRCMEVIDELEPVRRGVYTGSAGWLDFQGDLDLNIVIRTLVLKGGKGHLQVGAGIVHDSDPEREYEETLAKGEALAEALNAASVF